MKRMCLWMSASLLSHTACFQGKNKCRVWVKIDIDGASLMAQWWRIRRFSPWRSRRPQSSYWACALSPGAKPLSPRPTAAGADDPPQEKPPQGEVLAPACGNWRDAGGQQQRASTAKKKERNTDRDRALALEAKRGNARVCEHWQSAPVLLPGESHGQRSLVGYRLQGREESETTEWRHFLTYEHPGGICKIFCSSLLFWEENPALTSESRSGP